MPSVTFVESDGNEYVLEGYPGETVMELAKRNGLDGIPGDCGGACACATCHVYVEEPHFSMIGSPDEMEQGMIEFTDAPRENSRLGCQIILADDLDGLRVHVPQEQL